jgi:hypothetical protein
MGDSGSIKKCGADATGLARPHLAGSLKRAVNAQLARCATLSAGEALSRLSTDAFIVSAMLARRHERSSTSASPDEPHLGL